MFDNVYMKITCLFIYLFRSTGRNGLMKMMNKRKEEIRIWTSIPLECKVECDALYICIFLIGFGGMDGMGGMGGMGGDDSDD